MVSFINIKPVKHFFCFGFHIFINNIRKLFSITHNNNISCT